MNTQAKKTPYKRIALALSLCALLIWAILGTGASLAWFTDTSPEINNIFHFAEFDLVVSHRLTDGKWEEVDSKTKIFDEEALYEPGYVQVVYLKVENKGLIALRKGMAATVVSDARVEVMIPRTYRSNDYVLDPYTSLAFAGLTDYRAKTGESRQTLIVAERSPALDSDTVCQMMRISPDTLNEILHRS